MGKYIIFLTMLLTYSLGSWSSVGIGGGAYVANPWNVQKKAGGGGNSLTLNPMISFFGIWKFISNSYFAPEVDFVFHRNAGDDYGDQDKKTIILLFDFTHPFSQYFVGRYGIGTIITRISGKGGTVSVRNGASGTATAYKPEETMTSYNTTLNLGGEFFFNQKNAVKAEAYVMEFLSSLRRSVNYSLSYNYYF